MPYNWYCQFCAAKLKMHGFSCWFFVLCEKSNLMGFFCERRGGKGSIPRWTVSSLSRNMNGPANPTRFSRSRLLLNVPLNVQKLREMSGLGRKGFQERARETSSQRQVVDWKNNYSGKPKRYTWPARSSRKGKLWKGQAWSRSTQGGDGASRKLASGSKMMSPMEVMLVRFGLHIWLLCAVALT